MSIAEVQYMSSSRFGIRFRKRRLAAAATQAAAASRRFLNLVPNLDELMF